MLFETNKGLILEVLKEGNIVCGTVFKHILTQDA